MNNTFIVSSLLSSGHEAVLCPSFIVEKKRSDVFFEIIHECDSKSDIHTIAFDKEGFDKYTVFYKKSKALIKNEPCMDVYGRQIYNYYGFFVKGSIPYPDKDLIFKIDKLILTNQELLEEFWEKDGKGFPRESNKKKEPSFKTAIYQGGSSKTIPSEVESTSSIDTKQKKNHNYKSIVLFFMLGNITGFILIPKLITLFSSTFNSASMYRDAGVCEKNCQDANFDCFSVELTSDQSELKNYWSKYSDKFDDPFGWGSFNDRSHQFIGKLSQYQLLPAVVENECERGSP